MVTSQQAGLPVQLLPLIQAQLNPNAVSAKFLRIQADTSGSISGGQYLQFGFPGFLNFINNAWTVTASNPPIVYESAFPGAEIPLGEIWINKGSAGTFHVEMYN